MKKIFTLLVLSTSIALSANAQNGISDLFKGSPTDLSKLINAYADPLFKGFGNSLNGGYANTAKTLGTLRFCVRISASGSMVPQSDKTYDVKNLGLSSNIQPTDGNKTIAPTFGGSTDAGPSLTVSDPAHPYNPATPLINPQNAAYTYKFNLPAGVVSIIPAPQVQLTVGLVKNTDISVRFIPETKLSSDVGSVGLIGFGIKHNIAQDFGTAAKLVPFDLALSFGYTRLNYSLPLDVKPQNGNVTGSTDFSNQRLEGHFSGFNAQAMISKKLWFFTPFAAVGYSSSQTDVATLGNFPFVTGVTALGQPTYTTYANPVTVSGSDAGVSSLHADAGFQLSLTFFKIYASYSFASYQAVNAGIGLGF
jgi:hypothetical protein